MFLDEASSSAAFSCQRLLSGGETINKLQISPTMPLPLTAFPYPPFQMPNFPMQTQCDLVTQMFVQNMMAMSIPQRGAHQQMLKQVELQKNLLTPQMICGFPNSIPPSLMPLIDFNKEDSPKYDNSLTSSTPSSLDSIKGDEEEIPLDLSRKSTESSEDMEPIDIVGLDDHKSPFQIKSEPTGSDDSRSGGYTVKRTYTQMDLNSAVNDIRCGRLGTRRASVVYGIPRSTLRNKIYKLEAAEELAGNPLPFKRRKRGGQSSAEKKLADEVEKEKKIAFPEIDQVLCRLRSISPLTDCSSLSPAVSEPRVEPQKMEQQVETLKPTTPAVELPVTVKTEQLAVWDKIPSATADWTSAFWQNFINQQQLSFGSEIMLPKDHGRALDCSGEWKKTRPKRGQYRKYDKDALEKAVRSVRCGEMSVHRAGSFYGVPHSTLEYKVKERNLMRNKRKKLDDLESAQSLLDHSLLQPFAQLNQSVFTN